MNTYKIKIETTKNSKVDYNINHAYFFIQGETFPIGYLRDDQPCFWGFHANRFELSGRTFMTVENNMFTQEEMDAMHKQAQKEYAERAGQMYAKGLILND
jgi:predicted NAD-dependent protein-ADP-ribosyltransferase YbiA (DUF1768 family)